MSEKNADQIKSLYSELAKIGPSQDWEKILKVTKKILGYSVNETKAFQCKIVCLIQLDRFDEAITSMKNNPDMEDGLVFERAYCEYRLNRLVDAYDYIMKFKQTSTTASIKLNELLAQICYKLEKYQESYDLYREIIKNSDDDFDIERQTNLSAVVAALRMTNPASNKDLNMAENEDKTYELCYNSACISISKGNFEEARDKLCKAEMMCKKTYEDEEDMETLESEIVIIRIQLAYCLQQLGKIDEALKIYNAAMKEKSGDISITAVASNNMVCVNKDQNVFDSKKRFRAATGQELELKLNSAQKKAIASNEILFSIITNQNEPARRLIQTFEKKFKDDRERLVHLKTAMLYRDKKYTDAESFLKEMLKDTKDERQATTTKQYLLQVLLVQAKINDAIELIKSMNIYGSYKLGIISALVTLMKTNNDTNGISKLFDSAIEHYSKSNVNSNELEILIRENSNFQIAAGNLQNAADMLERMRQIKPNDFKILSKLIDLYSRFDPEKAKKLSKQLPSLEDIVKDSNLDLESLENQFNQLTSKYARMKLTAGNSLLKSPEAKAKSPAAQQDQEEKKKKKRKRKIRLPKNFDPKKPIDSERWLPLRERSYYRGRRNKKKNAVGKGTQGAVSSKSEGAEGVQQSPRPEKLQDKPTVASKPKGAIKKRKGGKW